jgi:hypothetical protein
MDAREFAAVVLTTSDLNRLEAASFGPGFVAKLTADYRPSGVVGNYFLYLPAPASAR